MFIFVLHAFFTTTVHASGITRPLSVRQFGMGYIVLSGQPDPLLLFASPVSIAAIDGWSAGSFYSRLFNLKDLSLTAFAGGKRFGRWVVGVGGSHFGFELFREQNLTLAAAYRLSAQFQWGVSLRYHRLSIKNYGSSGTISADAGWTYSITPNARLSGTLQNLNRAKIGAGDDALPQSFRMGFQFSPVDGVMAAAEIFKELDFHPETRFGIEVETFPVLKVRAGVTRTPARFTGGFSLLILGGSIDYGFSHHNVLGYTHAVGIVLSH
jgi:hypothetical protein